MRKTPDSRLAAIRAALAASRDGGRLKDLGAVLAKVALRDDAGAPTDELWLAAELAYRESRYADAITLFHRFDAHPNALESPPWQRYLSAHRKSFAALQLGRARDAQKALNEAQRILLATPDLRSHGADLDAMRAHLAELRGDFETAWVLFEQAYNDALLCKNWGRARTVASDLGRVAMIAKRLLDGLKWLRAARLVPGEARAGVLLTLRLREAILQAMLGHHGEALSGFSAVVGARQSRGELLADALARRADLYRQLGRSREAKRDLMEAMRIAHSRGLSRHELYAHKDLAALQLDVHEDDEAVSQFRKAIQLGLSMDPPPLLSLRHLLEDVLEDPRLIGRAKLTSGTREGIVRLLKRVDDVAGESAYQRGTRSGARVRVASEAGAALAKFVGEQVELASCTVNMSTGAVSRALVRRILAATDLAVLRLVLARPDGMSSKVLAEKLDKSPAAVDQATSRLRAKLGGSLVTVRRGRAPALHRIVRKEPASRRAASRSV